MKLSIEKYKTGTFFCFFFLASLASPGCSKLSSSKEPTKGEKASSKENKTNSTSSLQDKYTWVEVKKGDILFIIPASGSFHSPKKTRLGSQVSGKVDQIWVDVGSYVNKGDKLLSLDRTFFQIELDQKKLACETVKSRMEIAEQNIKTTRVEVEAAKNNLAEAMLQLTRMKNLWEKPKGKEPSIPEKLYDDSRFKYMEAETRLKGAESKLLEMQIKEKEAKSQLEEAKKAQEYAQKRLDETIICAPYNGAISKRMVDPGEPITSAPVTYLMEIQEMDKLDLEFSLPQDLLKVIQEKAEVKFEVEGIQNGKGSGNISTIYPALDEATRTFRCKVEIQNPKENNNYRYMPGLLAQVRVYKERKNVLHLPPQALTRTANGWSVLIEEKKQILSHPVEIGLSTDSQVEIKQGLREGQKVALPRN